MTRRAKVITLGCRANLAEAEALADWAGEGRTVVNSCAVTAEAVRDARKAVKQAVRQAGGQGGDVWVTGCAAATVPERFADLPVRIVEKPFWEGVGTLRSRGFVNIQDGCNHECTFCITRLARGRARSAPLDAVVARVSALVARGAVEIVLTGVDAASWGQDLPGRPPLSALVARVLEAVPALPRLRLSTLDPAAIDDGLIALFAHTSRLMPHVHLSLQSGDELILKRMRRRHGPDRALKLVERLRAARPELALGADVIAGFPTEAEGAHQRTRLFAPAGHGCRAHAPGSPGGRASPGAGASPRRCAAQGRLAPRPASCRGRSGVGRTQGADARLRRSPAARAIPARRPASGHPPRRQEWNALPMSDQVTEKGGFLARMRAGLERSSRKLSESLTLFVGGGKIEAEDLDAIEEALIAADLGPVVSARIVDQLREARVIGELTLARVREVVANEISAILRPLARPLEITAFPRPHVILVVGVNGTGKTTTIAKFGHLFQEDDYEVMFAAGDTFRAAAVEQLKIWGQRLSVPVISGPEGTDAAGLAFQAMTDAKASGRDVLLVDTAGRLQNKSGLMDELAKIRRVLAKQDATAPHDTILVLDATTGQNALSQIEIFQEVAGVTGLVMTKLDGTARGGVLVAAAEKFRLPIHALGVGERLGDLRPFDAELFARALAGVEG